MNIHLPAILMFTFGTRVLTHSHFEQLNHQISCFWDLNQMKHQVK